MFSRKNESNTKNLDTVNYYWLPPEPTFYLDWEHSLTVSGYHSPSLLSYFKNSGKLFLVKNLSCHQCIVKVSEVSNIQLKSFPRGKSLPRTLILGFLMGNNRGRFPVALSNASSCRASSKLYLSVPRTVNQSIKFQKSSFQGRSPKNIF